MHKRSARFEGKVGYAKLIRFFAVFVFVAAGALFFFASGAEAATKYWICDTAANFNDATCWSTGANGTNNTTAPGAADYPIFTSYGTGNVTFSADATIDGISTNDGVNGAYAGQIDMSGITVSIDAATGVNLTGGTLITNSLSTLSIGVGSSISPSVNFGSQSLHHLTINTSGIITTTGTVNVGGTFTIQIGGTLNGGTISVSGDMVLTDSNVGGTTNITMTGSANQSITGGGGDLPNGSFTINKASGTVTVNTSVPLGYASNIRIGWVVVTSGTLNMNGVVLYSDGLTVDGGSFDGSTADLSITGQFVLSSGTATSTSGTLSVTTGFTISGGTFVHNSGTVSLNAALTINTGSATLNNLTYNASVVFTATGTVNVAGTLTIASAQTMSGGTISVSGNMVLSDSNVGGTTNITMTGSANQSITGGGGDLPNGSFTINKASGTVTVNTSFPLGYASNIRIGWVVVTSGTLNMNGVALYADGLTVDGGSFNGSTADLSITGQFVLSSGTATSTSGTLSVTTGFTISGGTFVHNSGTVSLNSTLTINTGSATLNNLTYNASVVFTSTGTVNVAGTLTIASAQTMNGGTISVSGNMVLTDASYNGTTNITMTGSANQSITGDGGDLPQGYITINKSVGSTVTVNTSSALGWSGSARIGWVVVTSGTLNMNGVVLYADGLTVDGGSFNGSTADLSITGQFVLSSGTATSTSGTLSVTTGFTISGGTFVHNSGTVSLNSTLTINTGSATLNNLTYNASVVFTATGTVNVAGTLTIASAQTMNGGTISVSGNMVLTDASYNGTTNITMTGSANQSITGDGGDLPQGYITINKSVGSTVTVNTSSALGWSGSARIGWVVVTSGTLNMNGVVLYADGLTVDGGSFNGSTADLSITGQFVLSSGTATSTSGTLSVTTGFTISGGTFVHNSGTVSLNSTLTINTGSATLNNLTYNSGVTFTAIGTVNVAGTLTIASAVAINGGTLSLSGNLVLNDASLTGSTFITFVGGADQTISGAGDKPDSNFTINKTVGSKVSLGVALTLNSASQSLIITSGTLDLAGYALTVNGTSATMTVAAAGTLQLQGGEVITALAGYPSLATGSTVTYNGTVGPYTLLNYSYSNLTINGSATFSAGAAVTVGGNLTVSAGTLDLGAYTANRSTSGGTLTVANGATLKIGNTGTFPTNYITNTLGSTSTVEYNGTTQTVASQTYGNLTLTGNTTTKTAGGAIAVVGNLTINTGVTLALSSYSHTVTGNWVNSGGSTTAGTGTVTFNGADGGTQIIYGTNSFYNLTKTTSTATSTLQFAGWATSTVANTMTLQGGVGRKLNLRSTTNGTTWYINPQGTRTVEHLDVQDSENFNASDIDCVGKSCINSGNNVKWLFGYAGTFDTSFPSGGNYGVNAYQETATTSSDWGKVNIIYKIQDYDPNHAKVAGTVSSSFKYSAAGGAWTTISGNIAGATTGLAVDEGAAGADWQTYTNVWDAKTSLGSSIYAPATTTQVTIVDTDETGNSDTSATSTAFVLDTTSPTGAANTLRINGLNDAELTSDTVSLTITSGLSDNSNVYVQFATSTASGPWFAANSNQTMASTSGTYGTATTTGVTLGPWTWDIGGGTTRSRTVYARITDIYGNVIGTNLSATATMNNTPTVTSVTTPSVNTSGSLSLTYTLADADASASPADTTATTTLMYNVGITTSSAITDTSGQSVSVTGGNASSIVVDDVLQIDSEMVRVTAVGGSLTVTRGFGGSVAATHSSGATVWLMASSPSGSVCTKTSFIASACTPTAHGSAKSISWIPSADKNLYYATAVVKVSALDGRPIAPLGSGDSGTFEFDSALPVFSSFNSGTATTNNIQYTDADSDTVADNRSVTLRIVNLTEHSSSTQGVYLLFSNNGTDYGTSVNTTTGVVTAVSEGTLSNWEQVLGANVASYSKSWTLLQSGSRTKTVYIKVRDAYGNIISSAASANVSFNKRPEFDSTSISDGDASNYEVKTNSSGKVVIRQCNVFDTDANCTAGKVKIKYSVRDPDANESPLTSNGNLHITYATSSDNITFATSTNSDLLSASYATTTVSLTNADSAGSYSPSYTTGTAYFNPGISSGNLYVRIAVSDNEETFANSGSTPPTTGTPAVYATSNVIAYDSTKPTSYQVSGQDRVFEFDAGVAGTTNGASVYINHPTDATTTQYLLAESSATTTTWLLMTSAATTTKSWTFDSDIEKKSLSIKFRDTYGNEQTATTTVTNAAFPLSPESFLVQDVSKAAQNDWRLYIAWQTSTSTDFASYKVEYATSSSNTEGTFTSYQDVTTITDIATNYYVHLGLDTTAYYRYRVGVKDDFGNITPRSSAFINAKPDGVQNLGEGGGGSVATASNVTNVQSSQGATGNVAVTFTLTDTSISTKTSPAASYEAYVAYDLGVTLTSSSTSYIELSDTSKMPSSGFIQINQEVIGYTANNTGTNQISGITRGTWPANATSRTTRQNTNMLAQTQAWIIATSTVTSITNTSISSGQANNSITWTTSNDTNLASQYLTNVGVRVLVHDNQAASSAPLSSQSDASTDSTLAVFDKKAPTLTSSTVRINGSSSSIEVSGTTAPLTLTGVSGDTASESIFIQFATSTPAVYRGANSDGTLNMTENSWGTATSTASLLGSWSWPLSGRSETVTVRLKDAYGNISSTDTNSITKNAVPEFQDTTVTNADATGYESLSNNKIAIRQCNVYDTDALCTQGRVKIKFNVRDPDAGESQLSTAGSATTTFAVVTNGVFATSTAPYNLAYWASDASYNTTTGTSTVATAGATSANAGGLSEGANYDPAFTSVTVYYTPTTSGTIRVQASVTDGESGSTPVYALSNQINFDNSAPTTGALTFDGGVVDGSGADRGSITVPVPADATTTQYMLSATTTDSALTTWGWTTYTAASSTAWGFDAPVEAKSVYYRYRDTYGNMTATATATSLVPPTGSSITIEDISTSTSPRIFLSWPKNSDNDFANYRIDYATSSTAIDSGYSAYAELALITNKDTNYFIHTGLDSSWWYRYRLSTKNTAGNYSVKSLKGSNAFVVGRPDQTLTGDEAYASDTIAPSITSVSIGTPQVTSIAITLQDITDGESLNLLTAVYYAPTDGYNSSASGRTRYAYKFGSSDYVAQTALSTATSTTITVAGLTKNQVYYYAVEACDVTGNCTLKEHASYTFTTADGPAIVSGSISPADNSTVAGYNSATVTWKTDKASDSIIYYAGNSALTGAIAGGSNSQVTSAGQDGNFDHSVSLSSLSSSSRYYYKVRSSDTGGQFSESLVRSFYTGSQPTPLITTAASCEETSSTGIISWVTDQNTTTEVSVLPVGITDLSQHFSYTAGAQFAQYPAGVNSDGAWTTWRNTADLGTQHTYTVSGLTESSTYLVKVRSLNSNGGEITGTTSCVTPAKEVVTVTVGRSAPPVDTAAPLISGITIKDLKATSATITWTTDELADSLVQYGTTLSYGSLNGNVDLLGEHTVVLSGLNPQTSYNFKATSADRAGNRAYAGDQTFTTLSVVEEALLAKEDLETLKKELEEFRKQAKSPQSLQEAAEKLKAILKSVSSDIALGDLETLASEISDTITDITQEVVPPTIIGGVPQVDVESTRATVKWRTNKASGSLIALVPQSEYSAKAKEPYTLQVGQPKEEVTEHSVTIPNLDPSTVYHFQIRSQAKVGPEGKSRDFVFETKAELPTIVDYSFKRITENSITVAWKTNTLSTSLVRYTPFEGTTLLDKQSNTQGKPEFVKDHEVTVSNLKSNTNFLIEISSADVTGATASKVIGTVRTTLDAKGPLITKVRSESTIFPGKAEKTQTIIYWETDEPSTSQVYWKEGVAKGDFIETTRFDQEYTTSHVTVITSFKPGAVYRFQVESVDPSNNKSRSSDYTILTPKKGETVIDLIITNFQDIFGFLKKI